jgi:hypothetical protein
VQYNGIIEQGNAWQLFKVEISTTVSLRECHSSMKGIDSK